MRAADREASDTQVVVGFCQIWIHLYHVQKSLCCCQKATLLCKRDSEVIIFNGSVVSQSLFLLFSLAIGAFFKIVENDDKDSLTL